MRLHVPIPLRWADLDAYGHVNNARLLSLLEEARVQAFWISDDTEAHVAGASTAVLDATPGSDTITLIAHQEVEYLAPIPYLRAPLDVQLWMGRLGGASLEVAYEIHNPVGTTPEIVYARASTTVVLVNSSTQKPRRMTEREREAWLPYLEDPIAFRRS
jgi:acyl-CoA thioester hydrolase